MVKNGTICALTIAIRIANQPESRFRFSQMYGWWFCFVMGIGGKRRKT